jgi:hypothetical protein
MAKLLYGLRERGELSAELWEQFRARTDTAGHSPSDAIARLIRRFLAKGFDDGKPERKAPTDLSH